MSNMKCPFCQQELKPQTMDGGWLECWNCSYSEPNSKHLPQPILCGSRELWQELIHTRKALDIAVDALKLMYQGNGDPQDIMRYKDNRWTSVRRLCKQTLEQITALEQKDK